MALLLFRGGKSEWHGTSGVWHFHKFQLLRDNRRSWVFRHNIKHCFYLVFLAYRLRNRPIVRGSKQVLDAEIHAGDSGFQVLDSSLCQWKLDSGFLSLWDSDFLSRFPDSKAQYSEFHIGAKFPGLWILRATISRISGSGFPFTGQ